MQNNNINVSRETSPWEALDKRRIRLFLSISFGLSWALAAYLGRNGGLADSPVIFASLGLTLAQLVIAFGYMWAPALAAIITRIATKEGWKDSGLAPNFKSGRRYWLAAWLLPAILTLAGALIYFLVFPKNFDPALGRINALIQNAAAAGGQIPQLSTQAIALIQGLQAILIAPFVNSFFTFGEEFGWRAYLQHKLMPLGYRPALLITGLIWGLWHAPIIAMGHNYGLDYAGYPWLGIIAMIWFTVSVGVVFGWLALRGKSVWPAVIAHAAINGIAGLPLLFSTQEINPNMLIGPTPVGLLGGLPWLLLAIILLLKGAPQTQAPSPETRPARHKAPSGSAIYAEGLSKSFAQLQAVAGLDLDIPAGEVFGLLGPNGAGKTTSIRMLSALIAPSSGQAWVAGFRLGEQNAALRKSVGLLTEAPGLYTQLSAQRNLEFYAQMYEVADISAQVSRYLRMLGLWERRDEQAGTFSKRHAPKAGHRACTPA